MENAGYTVVCAMDGREGVEACAAQHFDLVLMDLQMPHMDGYEATTAIRKDLRLDVPIIALTGHVFREDEEKCRAVGMNDFLTKPVEINVLRERINKWT